MAAHLGRLGALDDLHLVFQLVVEAAVKKQTPPAGPPAVMSDIRSMAAAQAATEVAPACFCCAGLRGHSWRLS